MLGVQADLQKSQLETAFFLYQKTVCWACSIEAVLPGGTNLDRTVVLSLETLLDLSRLICLWMCPTLVGELMGASRL